MMRSIMPRLPAHAMKTYTVLQPIGSHFRVATCQEVGCDQYANGWVTNIDTSTPLGAKQANYIRLHSDRHFTASGLLAMVAFTFPAGQKCFREHRLPLDRPALFVVRGGDFRGNPRGTPARRLSDADWVDDFANHQQKLADRLEQG